MFVVFKILLGLTKELFFTHHVRQRTKIIMWWGCGYAWKKAFEKDPLSFVLEKASKRPLSFYLEEGLEYLEL